MMMCHGLFQAVGQLGKLGLLRPEPTPYQRPHHRYQALGFQKKTLGVHPCSKEFCHQVVPVCAPLFFALHERACVD